MLKEITAVRGKTSNWRDAAVWLLLRSGGMLREEACYMVIKDDGLVYERRKRTRKQTAAGAAASDAHFVVNFAVYHRVLSDLQLKRAAVVNGKRNFFLIAKLGHRFYHIHAIGAFDFVDASENQYMRTILFCRNYAYYSPTTAHKCSFVSNMGICVDFDHHRAV